MSAERFPVAVDSITISGQTDAACKKGEDFNAHINTICNDIHKFHGMKIVTHAPAQRPIRSTRRRSTRNATVDDQTDVITFCALTRRRIVSALWQVFLWQVSFDRCSRSNLRYGRGRTRCWRRGYAMCIHMIWAVAPRALTSLRPGMLVS